MTTHVDRWLGAFAGSLTRLARNPGRLNVLVSSDGTPSSTRLGPSADQARAVAHCLNAAVVVDKDAAFSDIDVVDSIRTAAPPDSRDAVGPASLVARLRASFGEDSLPDGLEQHLAELSEDALSALAARLDMARSVQDLLGSHYPATEPLPASLGSLAEAPRDGIEVWLLVESRVEMPVDEFVVAHWRASDRRWISESRFGQWKRPESNARGWLPIEAARRDPALRKAIRRRWHGSYDELRLRLGDGEATS